MFWPFKRPQRPTTPRHEPELKFVGEQDGPPERQLKSDLIVLFGQRSHVQRAFLVRAIFDDTQAPEVVLAIRSTTGPDEQFVDEIGRKFGQIFNRPAHLDIMFLSPEQEAEASAVCRAFYASDS